METIEDFFEQVVSWERELGIEREGMNIDEWRARTARGLTDLIRFYEEEHKRTKRGNTLVFSTTL